MWNYEVGMKGQWDTVRVNLAVYQMVWDDIQLFAQRVSDSATFFSNAGEAESGGIELEISGRPNDFFDYGLGIAYQNAEITSITAAEATMVGAELGTPLTSPDLQVSGHLQFTNSVQSGNELFGRMDFSYTDSMPNGFPFSPGTGAPSPNFAYTDSITKVDLSVGYVTDKWTAVLYAENALDEDGYQFIMPQTFFDDRHMTLRPRTIGVRFTYNK